MLTGDSPDIAMNIGYACDLLSDSTMILKIEQATKQDLMKYMSQALKNIQKEKTLQQDSLRNSVTGLHATVLTGLSFHKIL